MALGMRYTREIWIAGWNKGESEGQDPVWAAFGRQRQIGEKCLTPSLKLCRLHLAAAVWQGNLWLGIPGSNLTMAIYSLDDPGKIIYLFRASVSPL